MNPDVESEVRTNRSGRSILAVALIGPALLLGFWSVLPTARARVPVEFPLLVGGIWVAGWLLIGLIETAGDANGA